jgi:hypothetical protein
MYKNGSNFDNLVRHKEVGDFEVSVHDEVAVEVLETSKHLLHDAL